MNWLTEMWRRVTFLFRSGQMERELADEMRLHLDLRAAEQAGAPREAEAAARRRFGNVTQMREAGREAWGWAWLDSLSQDVRYGLRSLASSPGFTLTAVLSLALGIGANTSIFTIINSLMLRALPVEDPQRLVSVRMGEKFFEDYFTNPLWEEIRDRQTAFSGMLAYGTTRFDLAQGGESQLANGMWVSGDFFRVLGVPAVRGRVLDTEDDRHGGGRSGPVAVVSYRFWKTHYQGDPGVLGRTVWLDRHPFVIVGVTPPWFTGLEVDRGYDVAIPIGCEPILHTDRSMLDHRSAWWLSILGRIPPGSNAAQATARLNSIAAGVSRATLPATWDSAGQREYLRRTFQLAPAYTGFSDLRQQYRTSLYALMAVVGLVLLIACANIANLLLARAAARWQEVSIRMAIGAGRFRVVRQFLTESLLLSLLGACAGLLVARWGSAALVGFLSTQGNPMDLDVSPDLRVLAFTTLLAVLTGLLFGLAPAFRATAVAPGQVLKENARSVVSGWSGLRLGKALVAFQVALSLVLLVGAGLFAGTLRNLLDVDMGLRPQGVLLIQTDSLSAAPKAQRAALYQAILERLRRVPGVTAAAVSQYTPISGRGWNNLISPEGYKPKAPMDTLTYFNRVSPGYFRLMGTALLMGRDFDQRDMLNAPRAMILGQSAARRFFSQSNPLGKTVVMEIGPGEKDTYQVVGVVRDANYRKVGEERLLTGYVAMAQDPAPANAVTFEIRHAGGSADLAPELRAAIAEINPRVSLTFRNFETQVRDSLLRPRLVALLSGIFGALALLLAVVGLYGVTAYAVARRRSEIGIRMALGATERSVMRLVLREVFAMLALGTLAGLAISFAAGGLISSLLYGVRPADPATLALAAFLLAAAAALAGYIPAFRAAHLDPMTALREE